MNETTKKLIVCVVCALVLFCSGVCTGKRYYSPVPGELTEELNSAKSELEKLQLQLEQQQIMLDRAREQSRDVATGIDKSLELAEQAGESLGRIGQSILTAGATATTGKELLESLRTLNKELRVSVTEMQSQNRRLTEELRRIQSSSSF